VHAIVYPLVESKQPRLLRGYSVWRTVVGRCQLTGAARLVDEMPDLRDTDVRHQIIAS